ncbi:putative hydrolase [Myriangium duriaei CBS 260.36]|uniref:Hydrolase n=1 Tax=Myriangium duriaei CBS 260.36 TaxID=1168546 RepID=A0A9P4MSF0_9PEZI|nr:putative hydrolase [Myriangium duriaei CBS 260.36]
MATAATTLETPLRYADIGINLSDPIYRGVHHGKKAHDDDLDKVIERAVKAGCTKMMITGSDLTESEKAIQIAKDHPGLCYATVGVHPCTAHTFESHPGGPSALISALRELVQSEATSGAVAAFGEIGLDYDRLQLCKKETQLEFFEKQLDLAVELDLPLFLHSRAAHTDFEAILRKYLPRLPRRGCVHSFTGTEEEMRALVDMGFDIGVNGCSLKTEENLAVVRVIPLERLQLETDGPWCDIRPSHASSKLLDGAPEVPRAVKKEKWAPEFMVKGRNEPCTIGRVAHVVARVKDISVEELCETAWRNSIQMFGLGDRTD